jgi:catechol 2,3-dioxygenase-like lactoylglutathione lyase family enzyme
VSFLELVAIVVEEYDAAIAFFVDALGFDLVEDSPSQTNDGRPKRWVVVRPPGAQTGSAGARRRWSSRRPPWGGSLQAEWDSSFG